VRDRGGVKLRNVNTIFVGRLAGKIFVCGLFKEVARTSE
jgi:hypothetical protein